MHYMQGLSDRADAVGTVCNCSMPVTDSVRTVVLCARSIVIRRAGSSCTSPSVRVDAGMHAAAWAMRARGRGLLFSQYWEIMLLLPSYSRRGPCCLLCFPWVSSASTQVKCNAISTTPTSVRTRSTPLTSIGSELNTAVDPSTRINRARSRLKCLPLLCRLMLKLCILDSS
jgi:hypothetical protein